MLTSVHITQHKFVSDVQLLYGCPSIYLQDKNVTSVHSRYIKRATVVCKYISIIKMLVSVCFIRILQIYLASPWCAYYHLRYIPRVYKVGVTAEPHSFNQKT